MKTTYRITKGNPAMIALGYFHTILFDITGKGSTTEQKNLHLGDTKTMDQAVDFIREKMYDPKKDVIIVDHQSYR